MIPTGMRSERIVDRLVEAANLVVMRWPGRGRRVSSFRWLPQCADAPTSNCLDFGWRCRRLQKKRFAGEDLRQRGIVPVTTPAPQVVESLIAAAKS
jgi:hypothetical protein